MEQKNQMTVTNQGPRMHAAVFEIWVADRAADELLTPQTYLQCVDGCRPDEVCQRFALVESAAQRLGLPPEQVAHWHKIHDEMWKKDPALYREACFQWDRRQRSARTMLQLMNEVKPQRAEYLLEPYLPLGMLTVLGGVSGVGKTWLALHWAAIVSRRFAVDAPGAVYYFTQENDPAIVLLARLEALGADLSRIAIQRAGASAAGLTLDDPRLEDAARQIPPKLVIFDPIQSYLGAGVEMNKANEVRPVLDWLSDFARRYRCAVVLVSHMSKPSLSNTDALDRLLGSSDFRNAARSIIIVGRDPDDPEVRVFAHAKNSIGQPGPSRRYRVSDAGVTMLGECDLTANEIIRPAGSGKAGRPASSLHVAVEALKELLGDKGWTSLDDVKEVCEERGISLSSMQRAKNELGVKVARMGHATRWVLPKKSSRIA